MEEEWAAARPGRQKVRCGEGACGDRGAEGPRAAWARVAPELTLRRR